MINYTYRCESREEAELVCAAERLKWPLWGYNTSLSIRRQPGGWYRVYVTRGTSCD